jgi:group I intron endonuclease
MSLESKCIYKATNLIDGKVYIGQTNNLERRIREHRSHAVKDGGPFHEEIRHVGLHNFKFDILEWCRSDVADDRERFYIAQFRELLGSERVYNFCDGGLGGQTHDVSGMNNPSFGKVYSDEERADLSKKLKGRAKPEGFGEKISNALKGRPKSREQVMKKSHPISVVNMNTGEILDFSSKSEMERELHCCMSTIMKGGMTRNGYRLYESKIACA